MICSGETEAREGGLSSKSRLRKTTRTPGTLSHSCISAVLDRGALKNVSGRGLALHRGGCCLNNPRCKRNRSVSRGGGGVISALPFPLLQDVSNTHSGVCSEEDDAL